MNNVALLSYLEPLDRFFAIDGINEVLINKPGEIWVELRGEMKKYEISALTFDHLRGLADLVARSTEQMISEEKPLLSGTLPNGFRVQVVIPPACETGSICYAIRKPSSLKLSLDDYQKFGLFDQTAVEEVSDERDDELGALVKDKKIKEFIQKAILYKKNIVIAGGTSTGKTTFANAMLRAIPEDERLITIEDAREIDLSNHENKLHLLASKGGQGRSKVTTQDLIEACLRLRPDRIIVGELRGAEAFSFLRAINTGHPGSIATVHADTPAMALEQLKLMVMQAGLGMPPQEIKQYIGYVVDIVLQLKREHTGKRILSEVYFKNAKDRNVVIKEENNEEKNINRTIVVKKEEDKIPEQKHENLEKNEIIETESQKYKEEIASVINIEEKILREIEEDNKVYHIIERIVDGETKYFKRFKYKKTPEPPSEKILREIEEDNKVYNIIERIVDGETKYFKRFKYKK
jgi:type IV secretion system protein VirB11